MDDPTTLPATPGLPLPQVLQPRLDDTPPPRARRTLERLSAFGTGSRVDPRFRTALQQLVNAVQGLGGLRVLGMGGQVIHDALTGLGRLIAQVEQAADAAATELEAERPRNDTRSRPRTRSRGVPATPAQPTTHAA